MNKQLKYYYKDRLGFWNLLGQVDSPAPKALANLYRSNGYTVVEACSMAEAMNA